MGALLAALLSGTLVKSINSIESRFFSQLRGVHAYFYVEHTRTHTAQFRTYTHASAGTDALDRERVKASLPDTQRFPSPLPQKELVPPCETLLGDARLASPRSRSLAHLRFGKALRRQPATAPGTHVSCLW